MGGGSLRVQDIFFTIANALQDSVQSSVVIAAGLQIRADTNDLASVQKNDRQ